MKNSIIWICIIAIMLFACKAKTTESAASESLTASDLIINPGALVQMDLSVEGMTCTGCENTINEGVSEIAGVVEVSSSFKDGRTFVKYDSTQTNIDKISRVINEKGYNVKEFALRDTEEKPVPATQ
jgi:mercuric ion transport protein